MIGVPDEKWGEVVVAYVQPRPGLTVDPAALEALCAHSLSGYKRPTSYVVGGHPQERGRQDRQDRGAGGSCRCVGRRLAAGDGGEVLPSSRRRPA
ncbi:hypothetical protein ACFXKY_04210 [Streptomyces canus]|uniref:AMP-binding enzyme n=1 Tax=Streptomyces canus TaxID=58343 RepID=UPI003697D34A